jgi:hypothetical protein
MDRRIHIRHADGGVRESDDHVLRPGDAAELD